MLVFWILYINAAMVLDVLFKINLYLYKKHFAKDLKGKSVWKRLVVGTCFVTLYALLWPIFLILFGVDKLREKEEWDYE